MKIVSRTWLKERRIGTQNVFLVQVQTLLAVNKIFVHCLSSSQNDFYRKDFASKRAVSVINASLSLEGARNPGGGGGGTWVNFCWVCAAGLSEPLLHCSLFCGQL